MTGPPPGASFFLFKGVPVAGKYAFGSDSLIIIYPYVMQKLHSGSLFVRYHSESPFGVVPDDSNLLVSFVSSLIIIIVAGCCHSFVVRVGKFHQFCFVHEMNISIEKNTFVFILTFGCGFEDQELRSAVWRSGHCTSAYDWRTLSIHIG